VKIEGKKAKSQTQFMQGKKVSIKRVVVIMREDKKVEHKMKLK